MESKRGWGRKKGWEGERKNGKKNEFDSDRKTEKYL